MADDVTQRFTSRVDDYVAARPAYPTEAIDLLLGEADGGLIADVGSGTGILTRQLLEAGADVVAVEPNAAMRGAAEIALTEFETFHSVEGTAEATNLEDESADLVVAAQAFHWFDREAARREFVRILRAPKRVALVWNERMETGTPFLEGYEALLREHGNDYLQVRHRAISASDLDAWFGGGMRTSVFPNVQRFDFPGLSRRLLSSSYAPQMGEPKYETMMVELRRLFDETQNEGTVDFTYETQVYFGILR